MAVWLQVTDCVKVAGGADTGTVLSEVDHLQSADKCMV